MANITRLNLRDDVEDMAPRFGYDAEARFAREPLGLERSGLSLFRLEPGFRFPFGHRHGEQEEVYGPEGAEILAFGAPNTDNNYAELVADWWPAD